MQGTLKGSGITYNCIKAKARTKGQKASPHLAQQEKVNVLRHANEGGGRGRDPAGARGPYRLIKSGSGGGVVGAVCPPRFE